MTSSMQQAEKLHRKFDELQLKHGDPSLSAIYGAGNIKNAKICLVFMNPTMKNVASFKTWDGLRAPWIGTKSIWNLLSEINIFDSRLNKEIQNMKAQEWTSGFANQVYKSISVNKTYITNLSKATQVDARPLKNAVFNEYLPYLKQEIFAVNPQVIISFGNQVSSILLGKNIKVSKCRKVSYKLRVNNKDYPVYPVYYPVGQGMRNIKKAALDMEYIIKML